MKNVKKRINEIKQKREEMITRIENKIEEAERDIRIANSEVTKAQSAGDFDVYDAALEEVRKARLRKQMYTEKLEAIKRDNVITAEEAKSLEEDLRQYIKSEEKKALDNAKKVIAPLEKDRDRLNALVDEANKLLWTLNVQFLHKNYHAPINTLGYSRHINSALNILDVDLPKDN